MIIREYCIYEIETICFIYKFKLKKLYNIIYIVLFYYLYDSLFT